MEPFAREVLARAAEDPLPYRAACHLGTAHFACVPNFPKGGGHTLPYQRRSLGRDAVLSRVDLTWRQ